MSATPARAGRGLAPEQLRRRCDPALLDFDTTDRIAGLEALPDILGQPRAAAALEFGTSIRRSGYNVFAFGPVEAEMHAIVQRVLARRAAGEPAPRAWVYVYDFDEPHRPRAIALPPGRGNGLRADMTQLIESLRAAIPALFESDEYRARARVIEEEVKEHQQKALEELEAQARAKGIGLLRTPVGLGFAPVKDEEVVSPDEFQRLPEAERERIAKDIGELQEALQQVIAEFPRVVHEARERLKALNREYVTYAVGHLIAELRTKHADVAEVVAYLEAVERDVIEHAELLRGGERERRPGLLGLPDAEDAALRRYQVNVLVEHEPAGGAPILYEPHPTYQNLVGRVEHMSAMGTLLTDFTLIKPGALHRANGGYLLLDARRVLMQPYAWEGLKQALAGREIRIESLGQVFSIVSTVSLEPAHVPLDVKVVLVGEPLLYYLLHAYDPDFRELFRVPADFDDRMPRTPDDVRVYARYVAARARAMELLPLDRAAVALVIEHAARLTDDAERLTTRMQTVGTVLEEADHRARGAGRAAIGAADVQGAIDAAFFRADRVRARLLEETERGTILIDTAGERVAQVNGLSVLELGDVRFGRPSRITARVRIGRGEVVDIEREVELGGPLHSKGVLILAGFLAARYAAEEPLSLSATLAFEQSYGGVEGDSASSAELYALLSALAELPIGQGLAVTGSVNQHGTVQAIGGVNEKVEGFFDLCRARGLDGRQGVLIPAANTKHLMLRTDVVEAVAAARFHVYPVATIDEGIELLTGVPAGVPDAAGTYPEGTVNRRVADRLHAFAARRRAYGLPDRAPGTGA